MHRLVRIARCNSSLLSIAKRNLNYVYAPIQYTHVKARAYCTPKADNNTITITESEILPNNIPNTQDALDMADQFLADLNFKGAIEKYTEVIKQHETILPEGVPVEELYSRRAQCFHKLRKFKEARADCQTIIDTSDKKLFLAEAHRRIGDMIIDEDAYSAASDQVSKIDAAYRAINEYNKSIALQLEEDTFCSLGSALLTVKEYKTAEKAFSDALRIEPNLTPALQGKGDAFIGQGFWGKAKDCYEEFIRLHEEYYATFSPGELVDINVKNLICQAHFKLARITPFLTKLTRQDMELMEPDDVKKHCQTLLDLDHLFIPQAYSFMARAFFIEEKFWECIDYCNKALQLDSSMFRVFKVRSAAYEQLGLTEEANQDEHTHQFLSSKKQTEVFHLENKLRVQLQKLAEDSELQQSQRTNKHK